MRRIIESVIICFVSLAFAWLLLSILVYNLMGSIQDLPYCTEGVFNFFETQKIVLRKLIKFAETPCFFISFMVYLIYGILWLTFGVIKRNTDGILQRYFSDIPSTNKVKKEIENSVNFDKANS